MNGKKAKALRRLAKRDAAELPEKAYTVDYSGAVVMDKSQRDYYRLLKQVVTFK